MTIILDKLIPMVIIISTVVLAQPGRGFETGRAYNPQGSIPSRAIHRGMGRMGGNAKNW